MRKSNAAQHGAAIDWEGRTMNAAQKREVARRKQGKVYSLPRGERLPSEYGRARVYMDAGERTYAYVGWHPTYGEHRMVRQGKIKLTGRLAVSTHN